MRIPVLAGRGFQRLGVQRDGDVIISQRAAATIWNDPTGSAAVGRRLALAPSGPTYTVVGVVGDVRDHDLATAPSATVYMPQVVPIDPRVGTGCATDDGARRQDVRAAGGGGGRRQADRARSRPDGPDLQRRDDERRRPRVDGASLADAHAHDRRRGDHAGARNDRVVRRDGVHGRAQNPRVRRPRRVRRRPAAARTGGRDART